MRVRLNEVVDGEVVFAIKDARAASDDLLKFDDGADWPEELLAAPGGQFSGTEGGALGWLPGIKWGEITSFSGP